MVTGAGRWVDVVDMACDCRTWPVQVAIAFASGRCGLCRGSVDRVVSDVYPLWVPDPDPDPFRPTEKA